MDFPLVQGGFSPGIVGGFSAQFLRLSKIILVSVNPALEQSDTESFKVTLHTTNFFFFNLKEKIAVALCIDRWHSHFNNFLKRVFLKIFFHQFLNSTDAFQ